MATKTKKAELVVPDGPADQATSGIGMLASVDIKDVPHTGETLDDEHILLTAESWVILGEAPGVPDWAVGRPAAVISFKTSVKRDDNGDSLYEYTDPSSIITVRERSQGLTLSVPLDSCQRVSITGGRTALVNFP